MQTGQNLTFDCQGCKEKISFSILDIAAKQQPLNCSSCDKTYVFEDKNLINHLKLFVSLCQQIRAAEPILGSTSVGVDIQDHQVKIPFKLLLTRLTSQLDLSIGQESQPISFRFEPLNEMEGSNG